MYRYSNGQISLDGLIEYLMQQETILRKCKAVLDLSSVYEKMVQLCSKEDSRRPSPQRSS